jgi:uncharacterized protein with HEPN domain
VKEERRDPEYLGDILDSIEKAERFVEGMTYEEFAQDDKTIFALTRAIEIIGEATKRISQATRDTYPSIPWRAMAGMRDKLIHDYTGINLQVLWQTAREDMRRLKPAINSILSEERPHRDD